MKRCAVLLIILLFSLISVKVVSQNETKQWYFGAQAGLDFMGPPTILTNGMMNPWEGCASIADGAGALLFYTDGISVWNKTHAVMANGTGLMGNSSSTQSGVIVKRPGSNTIYYIFTVDAQGGVNGLRYSIVDMTLAAGNGSVTVKNTLLYTPSTERITAVRHCNGVDVWVVTHDWNSAVFRTYLLTSAGLGAAVLSTVGTINNGGSLGTIGQMKVSSNGRKLAYGSHETTAPQAGFHLFDFDNTTGLVSNYLYLGMFTYGYGVEFSPDNTKLYCGSSVTNKTIYQWNICAGTNAQILASQYSVFVLPTDLYSFQLAPNGKIYVCRYSQQVDGVINNPNVLGAGCNYVDLGQSTAPRTNNLGLPNFVTSYLKAQPTPYTYTTNPAIVTCLTASFTAPPAPSVTCASSNYSVTGYNWTFGDPPSGPSNTSTATNPTHTYPGPGTYTTTLIINFSCGADTVLSSVVVSPCTALPIELVSFKPSCLDNTVQLNWETASEKNNDFFTIRRSTDGTNYDAIATIKGKGTSSQRNKYVITDKSAEADKLYYYKLSQTDFNNTEENIGGVVYISCEQKEANINLFPTPLENDFFIISNKNLNNVVIDVFDALGQKVKQTHLGQIEKNKKYTIRADELWNGCYYVLISSTEEKIQKKIVVYKER